jgi:hypothetical protein
MGADDVVSHLVGVQAQVLRAAGVALAARDEGLTAEAVTRARIDDRSIVLAWAMRGTLHLMAAEDHGRFAPVLTEPHIGRSMRRLREEGVSGDDAERAVGLIERMLAREGPLTRPEIARRLRRRGLRTEGQAIAHLVWLAAAERGVCFGPDRNGARAFVLARDWIGEANHPAERQDVARDLAHRYLRAHAPATEDDFAAWSGLPAADSRRAWSMISDRASEVATPLGPMQVPRTRGVEAPPGQLRLLPEFDEYLLGWSDRRFTVPAERRRAINAGGGLIRPAVLRDGVAIATWKLERLGRSRTFVVHPFGRMSAATKRAVVAEAERIAEFEGATRAEMTFANGLNAG